MGLHFPWEEKSTQLQYSWVLKISKKEKNKNPCAVEVFVKACFRYFPSNGELDEFDTFWQIWMFWALRLTEHYEMFHLLVTFPYKHQKKCQDERDDRVTHKKKGKQNKELIFLLSCPCSNLFPLYIRAFYFTSLSPQRFSLPIILVQFHYFFFLNFLLIS